MKRRDFICGMTCLMAGFAFSELRHLKFDNNKQNIQDLNQIPGFGIATSSHCNLNCKGCDTYSPLAKEEFVTYEQLKKDLIKLKELHKDAEAWNGAFMGGEPLLNPDLENMIELVFDLYPKSMVKMLTNGILLDQKDDRFWKLIKKHNIELNVTKYPINIDREKYQKLAKKYGVKIGHHYVRSKNLYDFKTKKIINTDFNQEGFEWSKNILDLSGKQDYIDKKYTCPHRGINIYARGNIYACYVHAYINAFIDYFKVNIPITKDDFIRIEDIESISQIEDFLNKPNKLCRFCKQCHNTCYGGAPLEWDFSKREISEWT